MAKLLCFSSDHP